MKVGEHGIGQNRDDPHLSLTVPQSLLLRADEVIQ